MSEQTKSYDPKSRELAEHFLADVKPRLLENRDGQKFYDDCVENLSQEIQDTVEAWMVTLEEVEDVT